MEGGQKRAIVENVQPEIDCGRFPIKRTVGEPVEVDADVFSDGHDAVACRVLFRHEHETRWREAVMEPLGNDRWRGRFEVTELGIYHYNVEAWVDHFLTWRRDLVKRIAAGQDITVELLAGARFAEQAAARAAEPDAGLLLQWSRAISEGGAKIALNPDQAARMTLYPDRRSASRYKHDLSVTVDREKARFSSWYELFPRSWAAEAGRHGTFRDVEARLPYVAGMGFDVLYLPPIHPIGRTWRKGPNNTLPASPDDPGSPWAIGAAEGGHTEIHPQLGTLEDFRRLAETAGEYNLEIALDIAFQATPDHPWVREHPEWFRKRPDGSIRYAENPPKKYQDIYPLDFESEDWRGLWNALRDVILFWAGQGVKIFRVDNPHTKAFPFWEWVIAEVKRQYPEAIFLAEAFTRPKVMYRLAKLGFTQSYTYFTWRNTKRELMEYLEDLNRPGVREFFRPNFWPNTPDILPEYLQFGGRPGSMIRLVLAATLSSNYGIYGPVFELGANAPREPGSEEYLHSEKYEIRRWDLDSPWSLREFIARVNRIRRENPALQSNCGLRFHGVDNEMLLCFSKTSRDGSNVVLAVVNLDFAHRQSGWVHLDLKALGLDEGMPYQTHDLLGDARFLWYGARNFVELDPQTQPAHILAIRRRVKTERDFDYYL